MSTSDNEYKFTLEANEISLFNNLNFTQLSDNEVMTKSQINQFLDYTQNLIVSDAPEKVNTMSENF